MKKSKKERRAESRDDGLKKGSGVNYAALSDRRVDDIRHEREKELKMKLQQRGVSALKEKEPAVSSTFDAFQRMAAGKDSRTLADKIAGRLCPNESFFKTTTF